MTVAVDYLGYRRLRAPRENGTGLFEPAWDEIGSVVNQNLSIRVDACYELQGKCLGRLAQKARLEMLAAARHWTASYRDIGDWATRSPNRVFLAGHQPQMFHPGVWLKNFALSRLAEEHDAVAVNLIVDSDTIRSHTLRVPGKAVKTPTLAEIPYDANGVPVPFEERRILDPQLFASFADRVQKQIRPLVAEPLMSEYWRHVRRRTQDSDRLGLCLAQARHALEGEWGAQTLELPQSIVCDFDSYRWFLCHLLDESARFRQVHNEVVGEYRHVHRIRSVAHPVADLAEHEGWHEAPFWIWTVDNPRRRRLFVRRSGDTLCVTNRHNLEFALPISRGGDASRAIDCLRGHHREGIRIRSRALITTMWARLALGDLFVHGIGGAKYDQVTDALIAAFFRLKPPGFLTVSGTLHLPVPHSDGASDRVRFLRDRLRRLEFQPERFIDELELSGEDQMGEVRHLTAQKRDWIGKKGTAEDCRERFLSIRRLNERLCPWFEPIRDETLRELGRAEQARRVASLLTWREYAFCLFPGERLQDFFARLLPKRA
jgi:hypothetical protein